MADFNCAYMRRLIKTHWPNLRAFTLVCWPVYISSYKEKWHSKTGTRIFVSQFRRQNQMLEDGRKYEEQNQRNMVAMMEMQDTINSLQRELSQLGKQSKRPPSEPALSTAPAQVSRVSFIEVCSVVCRWNRCQSSDAFICDLARKVLARFLITAWISTPLSGLFRKRIGASVSP